MVSKWKLALSTVSLYLYSSIHFIWSFMSLFKLSEWRITISMCNSSKLIYLKEFLNYTFSKISELVMSNYLKMDISFNFSSFFNWFQNSTITQWKFGRLHFPTNLARDWILLWFDSFQMMNFRSMLKANLSASWSALICFAWIFSPTLREICFFAISIFANNKKFCFQSWWDFLWRSRRMKRPSCRKPRKGIHSVERAK